MLEKNAVEVLIAEWQTIFDNFFCSDDAQKDYLCKRLRRIVKDERELFALFASFEKYWWREGSGKAPKAFHFFAYIKNNNNSEAYNVLRDHKYSISNMSDAVIKRRREDIARWMKKLKDKGSFRTREAAAYHGTPSVEDHTT